MELMLEEKKNPQFYSRAQTLQNYAIWCSYSYLYGLKIDYIRIACNVNYTLSL